MNIEITDLDAPILPNTARELLLEAMRENWEIMRRALESGPGDRVTLLLSFDLYMASESMRPLAIQVMTELSEAEARRRADRDHRDPLPQSNPDWMSAVGCQTLGGRAR